MKHHITLIEQELSRANQKFPPFVSTHEAMGVLYEEVLELWEAVRFNKTIDIRSEVVQVGAMAVKFLEYLDKKK